MAESIRSSAEHSDRERWAAHLRRLAESGLAGVDPRREWREALARPHWIGGPLLTAMWVRRHGSLPGDFSQAHARESLRLARDDAALWWVLVEASAGPVERWIDVRAEGSLFRQDACRAIEVWTETELSALHALWHLARRAAGDTAAALSARIASAVAWHIQHTQPDNATNHPWAAHVFLLHGTPESRHFAETLVSNCIVLNGRPDPLSAWILLDAAEALETM